jgi:hypothetical protein
MTVSLVDPRKENIQLPTGERCERATETYSKYFKHRKRDLRWFEVNAPVAIAV